MTMHDIIDKHAPCVLTWGAAITMYSALIQVRDEIIDRIGVDQFETNYPYIRDAIAKAEGREV